MTIKQMLIFGLILLTTFGPLWAKTKINIDILENRPYIDYTLPFNSGFVIDLPDFANLIYLKILPNDTNYVFNAGKLIVNSNTSGVLVLKYEGHDFLDNHSFYDKTLDFNIFEETKINIQCDKNITKINTLEINSTNFSLDVNEPTTLHILIKKDPFRWQNITIILFCVVLIIAILLPVLIKRLSKKKKDKLYLDSNQQKVYDLVKTKKGITQQTIADTLNIRKSHMSKILNKMERNSLIERKKVGKVNKIILAERKSN